MLFRSVGSQFALSDDAANHVGRVLRMTAGQHLQLFDGSNQVFDAVITEAGKKNVTVEVLSGEPDDRESPRFPEIVENSARKAGFIRRR